MSAVAKSVGTLPLQFARWFAARGWTPRPHQLALIEHAARGESALLVAPTGGGKTLAGFLPTLIELSVPPPERGRSRALRAGATPPRIAAQFDPPLSGEGTKPRPPRSRPLNTLYISPLKALAVDVARNLEMPVAEMGLDVRAETRTGDTPPGRRQRQRYSPPDILSRRPNSLRCSCHIAMRPGCSSI